MLQRALNILLLGLLCFAAPLAAAGHSVAADTPLLAESDESFDQAFGDDFDREFAGAENQEVLIADPLEGWNRGVFWVNDKLYFYLIKPVAKGYRFVAPRPARSSVNRFFLNLATPIRAANALLQLKFKDFGTETYRFIINSTLGIGGLFDPAKSLIGIRRISEDFGQTLGYYGVGHGFYLVLPIIGPSSLRDATGSVVDTFFDPIKYAEVDTKEYFAVQTFKTINWLSIDPDTYEGIIRDAIDPYLFVRSAYVQRRMALVGKSGYNIGVLNTFQGTSFDFDIMNPLRWLGI